MVSTANGTKGNIQFFNSSNTISSAGVLTLVGGNSPDITTTGSNALSLDTAGSAAINIGATHATSLVFGGSQNPTYAFNGNGTFQTSTGTNTLGGNVVINGTTETIGNSATATIQTTAASNAGLNLLSQGNGNISLGQNSGNGTVVVQPNGGGQAALIVNKLGGNDIFTASDSGATKFTIQSDGTLVDAKYTGSNNGVLYAVNATGVLGTATTGSSGLCLVSTGSNPTWGSCSTGTTNYWQLNGNALSPISNSYDFLLGGTATTSADFGVTGLIGATPVASLSATANGGNGNGVALSATNATIQSLNNNTLNIGGGTTGNIAISPNGGGAAGLLTINAGTVTLNGTSVLNATSLGTVNTGATLTVSGATTLSDSGLANITTAAGLTMSSTTSLTLGNSATIS